MNMRLNKIYSPPMKDFSASEGPDLLAASDWRDPEAGDGWAPHTPPSVRRLFLTHSGAGLAVIAL